MLQYSYTLQNTLLFGFIDKKSYPRDIASLLPSFFCYGQHLKIHVRYSKSPALRILVFILLNIGWSFDDITLKLKIKIVLCAYSKTHMHNEYSVNLDLWSLLHKYEAVRSKKQCELRLRKNKLWKIS